MRTSVSGIMAAATTSVRTPLDRSCAAALQDTRSTPTRRHVMVRKIESDFTEEALYKERTKCHHTCHKIQN